jgi:hypothetical protein
MVWLKHARARADECVVLHVASLGATRCPLAGLRQAAPVAAGRFERGLQLPQKPYWMPNESRVGSWYTASRVL